MAPLVGAFFLPNDGGVVELSQGAAQDPSAGRLPRRGGAVGDSNPGCTCSVVLLSSARDTPLLLAL